MELALLTKAGRRIPEVRRTPRGPPGTIPSTIPLHPAGLGLWRSRASGPAQEAIPAVEPPDTMEWRRSGGCQKTVLAVSPTLDTGRQTQQLLVVFVDVFCDVVVTPSPATRNRRLYSDLGNWLRAGFRRFGACTKSVPTDYVARCYLNLKDDQRPLDWSGR
jgi:hypothetical protein